MQFQCLATILNGKFIGAGIQFRLLTKHIISETTAY